MSSSIAVLVLLASFSFGAGNETEESCVSCHRGVHKTAALEHGFSDWEQSPHAKSGVACQACHGGDASRQDKSGAHAGILPSTNSGSPVYFTQIPQTCGACHEAEFKAFQKSKHYKELQQTGRGPNCVTCHGSMASHIIEGKDMEMTCTLCHRQPTQAYAAYMAVKDARGVLARLKNELRKAKTAGIVDVAAQEQVYRTRLEKLHNVLVEWHTFDMGRVQAQARDIAQQSSAAYTELKLKGRNP